MAGFTRFPQPCGLLVGRYGPTASLAGLESALSPLLEIESLDTPQPTRIAAQLPPQRSPVVSEARTRLAFFGKSDNGLYGLTTGKQRSAVAVFTV